MLRKLIAVASIVILPCTAAHAGSVDSALVGKWATTPSYSSDKYRSGALLWHIPASGESTLSKVVIESGFFTTLQDSSWAVRGSHSSSDVAHGKYRIEGSGSFSTVIAGLPYEWITWTRVAPGSMPKGIEACLLNDHSNASSGESSWGEINPAFVGLWQASMTNNDGSRTTMAWHIGSNGRSTFIFVSHLSSPSVEASSGKLTTTTTDEPTEEDAYQIIDSQTFALDTGDATVTWTRCSK